MFCKLVQKYKVSIWQGSKNPKQQESVIQEVIRAPNTSVSNYFCTFLS